MTQAHDMLANGNGRATRTRPAFQITTNDQAGVTTLDGQTITHAGDAGVVPRQALAVQSSVAAITTLGRDVHAHPTDCARS